MSEKDYPYIHEIPSERELIISVVIFAIFGVGGIAGMAFWIFFQL